VLIAHLRPKSWLLRVWGKFRDLAEGVRHNDSEIQEVTREEGGTAAMRPTH
jgi:hypothetical protein